MLDKFWLICFFISKYIKYTYVSTHNFVENWYSKLFEVRSGLKKSSEVKQGSNPSNRRQIGPVGRNTSNIHMFRLRISSKIDIQSYLRSDQVIKKSSKVKLWSNPSNRGKIHPASWNTSNIHMFWVRILSLIDFLNYLRSDQVIKKSEGKLE